MTVTGALAYAELAAMMPKAGGQYVFLREGLSPLGGLPLRLDPLRRHPDRYHRGGGGGVREVPGRARARRHARRVPAARPAPPAGAADAIQLGLSPQRVVAIVMIAFLTAINIRGVTLGAAIQTVFSVAKVGALAVLVLLGLTLFRQPTSLPPTSPTSGAPATGRSPSFRCRRRHGGLALLERRVEQRHLRRRRGAEPDAKPSPRARDRTGTVSLLYILANVAYLNMLRSPATRTASTCSPAGSSTRPRIGWARRPSRWSWARAAPR